MTNVLFVHGTGVREAAYQQTFALVKRHLTQALPQALVHPCYWGDLGATLGAGASVPGYPQKMALGADDDISAETAWAALLHDPLVELRVLATQPAKDSVVFGERPMHGLLAQLGTLREEAPAAAPQWPCAPDGGLMRTAITAVMEDGATAPALDIIMNALGSSGADKARLMLARAIVAGWMVALLDDGCPTPLGDDRDALVNAIAVQLGATGDQQMGVLDEAMHTLLAPVRIMARATIADPSMRAATLGGKLFRRRLADSVTPAIGDIVLYQARGEPIRAKILQSIEQIGAPVVLVAHSLGGIACIDMLIGAAAPHVKAVITAGTQAPFLYEIGALCSLEKPGTLPAHMPPWLNFYDKNDILSFMAKPVMQGVQVVQDHEVNARQPFPASHSAYWTNPTVWAACADFLHTHALA